ncbi:neurotransmitter-gated ion-channel ligand binding domain-containing protein [Ditylenchus destructor]|uniref:Neurotransmitter-gated ion-channel ligand binding domain-containing protein n=1 Tax=Ditylenchus destructor TaxID=166010 RepID=A0AAD4NG36_9BILA|nr:neurotransmitter-gated ion-channel ligand binding domain-containing protein [Ditylenchus destructor]
MRFGFNQEVMLFTLIQVLLNIKHVNSQQKQLLEHLFDTYRKELRPVLDESSGPTNVTVQLYFKQIQKVQENDQTITLYCWIEEYWTDEFLRWSPDKFGGIRELHIPAEMLWKPDLLVYNNANMNVKDNEMQTNALVRHDGRVSLFRAIITDITCSLNLHRFPFDQQVCFLMLASWSYDGSQIMIKAAEEETRLNATSSTNMAASLTHYIPNMEWTLIDFKYKSNLKYYDCCPNGYPDICYYFSIKRNPSYYLFTLIVPSAFITIVTVVGFFTPHSSTGENTEKVSLGVTSLLSLALILMMVSDKLPATSNSVPLLGQYYIGLIVIQFVATYLTTWTLSVQMQGNSGRTIPRRLRQFILGFDKKNFFIKHFFGRELENTQHSIRLRIRKFDKLSALKRNFADHCVKFQQTFLHHSEDISTGNNTRVGSFNSIHRLSSNNVSPMGKNHLPVESLFCEDHRLNNGCINNNAVNSVTAEIMTSVQSIRQDLLAEEHLKTIRTEWQMLARMIEKILKVIFATFTMGFAVFMLYDDQSPPFITEEIMIGSKA